MIRAMGMVGAAVVICVSAYGLRCMYGGRVAYQEARRLYESSVKLARGDLYGAHLPYLGMDAERGVREVQDVLAQYLLKKSVVQLRRSLHWNVYSADARNLMTRIGEEALAKGNTAFALWVFQELRSSLYASRHLLQPSKKVIPTLDERIISLVEGDPRKVSAFKKALTAPSYIHTGWALVTEIGFFVWLLSVGLWIFKGFDRDGKCRWESGRAWMACSLALLCVWLFCLTRVS